MQVNVGSEGMQIANLLKTAGLTESTSEAIRMLDQGAVKVDGEKITEKTSVMHAGKTFIIQVGKRRFAKVVLA